MPTQDEGADSAGYRTLRVPTDDGAELHVETAGDPDSPVTVVFAHGWALSRLSWTTEFDALRDTAHVIRYDQRFHGLSTGPTETTASGTAGQAGGGEAGDAGGLSIDRLGRDLATVLESVAPSGPVVLAGHSMGGMTVMALAAVAPELFARRVAAVELVSTSAQVMPAGAHPPRLMDLTMHHHRAADRIRHLSPPSARIHRWLLRRMLYGAGAPPDAVLAGAEMIAGTPMPVIASFWPALLAHDKLAALAGLAKLPVTVMVGTKDGLTPVRNARAIAAELPDAKLVILPGRGHMLTLEAADEVAAELRALVSAAAPASPATTTGTTAAVRQEKLSD
jgi:pimeloyl-ACP methyl ester carboxylesterase